VSCGLNELDLVALDPDSNTALFGEVKWSRKPVGLDVLSHLDQAAAGVRWGGPGRKDRYCLFSRARFTRDLVRVAREEGVLLVEGDETVPDR
jgi:hypothetical protein